MSAPHGCVRGWREGTRELARVSLCTHWQISAEHTRNSVLFLFPLFIDELKALGIIIFLKIKQSNEVLEMQTRLRLA